MALRLRNLDRWRRRERKKDFELMTERHSNQSLVFAPISMSCKQSHVSRVVNLNFRGGCLEADQRASESKSITKTAIMTMCVVSIQSISCVQDLLYALDNDHAHFLRRLNIGSSSHIACPSADGLSLAKAAHSHERGKLTS